MKQFKVIDQLCLKEGKLKCKKPSNRSFQKAHFKQGDLDGACGAYSVSMALNILGVFEAEELYSGTDFDRRTAEWKLIKALNENGLYRNGLKLENIQEILKKNYSKYVNVQCANKKDDIFNITQQWIDTNVPIILGIDYDSHHGHWIVAVGYALNENDELTDILTLDPGVDSPMCCLWNGILNINQEPKKKYGYEYNTNRLDLVDVAEAIIITRKK